MTLNKDKKLRGVSKNQSGYTEKHLEKHRNRGFWDQLTGPFSQRRY